jgi:lipoate---protein ligase
MTIWRLIPLWKGSGQLQMAVDRWLFDQCVQELHPPVLRFYRWEPAAISLGYHQRTWPEHWQTLGAKRSLQFQNQPIDLVRRPTGGRAVLHAGDLTYCIVLPNQSSHRRQTYEYICEFLIQGWRSLGLTLHYGAAGQGYHRQVNCFESATAADLVTPEGIKFIGSAQAWRGQTVLQHGSMQLQFNPDLYQAVFGGRSVLDSGLVGQEEPLKPFINLPLDDAIVATLTSAAAEHFGIEFCHEPITAVEWQAIKRLIELPNALN